jgi:DNA-binding NarL/FixJ family response regulator
VTTPARVLVIDDHPLIRAGLIRAITDAGMVVCGEAANRAEAFAQIAHKNPDALIIDLHLPDGSGLDLVRWARERSKTIALITLTMSDEDSHLIAAMREGASAYILKSAPLSDVISALVRALSAPLSFTSSAMQEVIKNREISFELTPRELEILKSLTLNGTLATLAATLFISEATLKTHASSIYRKLQVSGRLGAVNKARCAGLV